MGDILFFDHIILYEDELHDNGDSSLSVKTVLLLNIKKKRVMEDCFFILLRFFLRVDNVLIRIIDNRIYHEIGSDHLIREYLHRESPISKIEKEVYDKRNFHSDKIQKIESLIDIIETFNEKIYL
jgi:type 2A phosphatase activator TIP41